jgi:hypothetical protein
MEKIINYILQILFLCILISSFLNNNVFANEIIYIDREFVYLNQKSVLNYKSNKGDFFNQLGLSKDRNHENFEIKITPLEHDSIGFRRSFFDGEIDGTLAINTNIRFLGLSFHALIPFSGTINYSVVSSQIWYQSPVLDIGDNSRLDLRFGDHYITANASAKSLSSNDQFSDASHLNMPFVGLSYENNLEKGIKLNLDLNTFSLNAFHLKYKFYDAQLKAILQIDKNLDLSVGYKMYYLLASYNNTNNQYGLGIQQSTPFVNVCLKF